MVVYMDSTLIPFICKRCTEACASPIKYIYINIVRCKVRTPIENMSYLIPRESYMKLIK